MRAVCFHGRRERDGGGDFLLAARIAGAAALRCGLFAQARTAMFPSAPGSPDRAIVRIDRAPLADLTVPRHYDVEVVCDPLLARVPPMGDALLPGGLLVMNAPRAPDLPPGAPPSAWADLAALASAHSVPPALPLAAAGWAGLARAAPELAPDPAALDGAAGEMLGRDPDEAGRTAMAEAWRRVAAAFEPA